VADTQLAFTVLEKALVSIEMINGGRLTMQPTTFFFESCLPYALYIEKDEPMYQLTVRELFDLYENSLYVRQYKVRGLFQNGQFVDIISVAACPKISFVTNHKDKTTPITFKDVCNQLADLVGSHYELPIFVENKHPDIRFAAVAYVVDHAEKSVYIVVKEVQP
jgi:hypothetical protein